MSKLKCITKPSKEVEMWNRIKKFIFGESDSESSTNFFADMDFKWHEVDQDNPIGMKFLDMRCYSQTVMSLVEDVKISKMYGKQRENNGKEFVGRRIENSKKIDCDLHYPHNDRELEGIIYKSSQMEEKWDIYAYDSQFLFVRSWTGELKIRAFVRNKGTEITIDKIEIDEGYEDIASQIVHFILGTHAFGQVLPHTIPEDMPDDPKIISIFSFGLFGNYARFATYEDITSIEIPRPED